MSTPNAPVPQPLAGLRVVEFTHMVMGPTCGMVLGDMGAEVIKVEPIGGENTRRLLGAGAGFFPMFNRNKKSIELDLHSAAGAEAARRLAASADVVIENFKPGTMGKYGLDYASLSAVNPRLIYVSHKGFLPGPYEHRTALDEVVQMMGGLAYMTGRPGDPLRAGTSVNDIMGGMFGAIGVLGRADRARHHRPRQGGAVGAVREQRLPDGPAHAAVRDDGPAPGADAGAREPVGDLRRLHGQGRRADLPRRGQRRAVARVLRRARTRGPEGRPALATNNQRVAERPRLMPLLRARLADRPAAELADRMERAGLPFAPIRKPEELFDDPHLLATGGLADVTLPDGERAGTTVKTTLLPLALAGARLGVRCDPPRAGEHTQELLAGLGYADEEITALRAQRAAA